MTSEYQIGVPPDFPYIKRTKVPSQASSVLKLSGYCSIVITPTSLERMNLGFGDIPKRFIGEPERRGTARFPLSEEVRYRVLHAKSSHIAGVGKTLNIGSGGILFTTGEKLPLGKMVEIAVNWPARLHGTCP